VNLQREHGPSLQHKIEIEGHRATGKGARALRPQDGLALLMGDCQRRDGLVVLLRGLRLPGGEGGQALLGAAFITDDGIGREACGQRCGIAGVFKLDIPSNGGGKLDGHHVSFMA
jgi:hypothetical protein